jgi:hypothetical protein
MNRHEADNNTTTLKISGKMGKATLNQLENGDRVARINFKGGKTLSFSADRLNLRAMVVNDVQSALEKACHKTGRVCLYSLTSYNGPEGMAKIYSSELNGQETGYGLFLKKGKAALRFALSRVDLSSMNAKTLQEAAKKATYTGRVSLLGNKEGTLAPLPLA